MRRAWRLAAEGLWKDICVVEFPTTRAIHALPGYRKSWLQLYGEMTLTRQPPAKPMWKDFKWVASVFLGKRQEQRLLGTVVCDVDDFFTETDGDGRWLIECEPMTLTEPAGITKDDIVRVDVVLVRGTDSKVCGIFDDKKGSEQCNYEGDGVRFFSVAEAVCPMKREGRGFELETDVWFETNLTFDEWEQGEMLTATELYLHVRYCMWEACPGFMDTIIPMLLR